MFSKPMQALRCSFQRLTRIAAPPNPLTARTLSSTTIISEAATYRQDGFVICKGLLSPEEVSVVRKALEADEALCETDKVIKLGDSRGGATSLSLWSNPGSKAEGILTRSHRIVERMRVFLGGDVVHYHSKTLLKEPKTGGVWNWHQDYGYWYKDYFPLPHMATAYVAIDAQGGFNGGLKLLRGSHQSGRLDHWAYGDQQGADNERVDVFLRRCEEVQCNLEAGDVVFFSALTLHASPGNPSDKRRLAFGACFTRADNIQYRDDFAGYIPCFMVEEVSDDTLLQMDHSGAPDERIFMESGRGKVSGRKDGSEYVESVNIASLVPANLRDKLVGPSLSVS